MRWIDKLKTKWQLSTGQVIVVLIVFACTGFTIVLIKAPVLSLFVPEGERTWLFTLLYYLFILPVYNVVLLIYGFLFGQFRFFWAFEKRMFSRMFGNKKSP
ncbi:prolipoprotein diacylglyceryl transferase [Fulvivirga sp. M361]|uniref:DUF6787 family protein n=1 Tax=Fulvivirga sp. M361 TaxID=2594266 RepID=UPI00117A04BD|nr:DUF6787 family protein [Fulvivirga sp. M361]TRX61294.1 prolipoprotein diacylglyceryl transferase [Fulvivirga sp. M361]